MALRSSSILSLGVVLFTVSWHAVTRPKLAPREPAGLVGRCVLDGLTHFYPRRL